MAFETLKTTGIEGDYWAPTIEGQQIEGNIMEFQKDDYNKTKMLLELPNEEQISLPGHADLQQYTKTLEVGDYIRVTLTGFKKSNNPEKYNDKPLYKVERDPERAVVYETQEELDE